MTAGSRYRAIYGVVRRIPRGSVATYGQVARLAGLGDQAFNKSTNFFFISF